MAALLVEFVDEKEESIPKGGKPGLSNELIDGYKKKLKKQFAKLDRLYEKDLRRLSPEGKEVSKKEVFKKQYGQQLAENLLQIGANARELVKGYESIARSDRPAYEKEEVYHAFMALLSGAEVTAEKEIEGIRRSYLTELCDQEIMEIKDWEKIQEFGFHYLKPAKEYVMDLFKEASQGVEDVKSFKEEKVVPIVLAVDGMRKKLTG